MPNITKTIKFFLLLTGLFSVFLLREMLNEENLNKIYFSLSLAPILDLSMNSRGFGETKIEDILILQIVIGTFLCLIISEEFLILFFVLTRQILTTIMNRSYKLEKYNVELNIRIYLSTQLIVLGLLIFIFTLNQALLALISFNLFLTFILNQSINWAQLTLKKTILYEIFKISNLSMLLGALYISLLFKITNSSETIYLIIGLQVLNLVTNTFHFVKEYLTTRPRVFIILNNYVYQAGIILSITVFSLGLFSTITTSILVISIVLFEILQVAVQNERIRRNDFLFSYRLILVVIAELLFLNDWLALEILIFVTIFYYFLNLRYGKTLVLGSRPL